MRIATTINIPTPTPAWNISPTNSQLLKPRSIKITIPVFTAFILFNLASFVMLLFLAHQHSSNYRATVIFGFI